MRGTGGIEGSGAAPPLAPRGIKGPPAPSPPGPARPLHRRDPDVLGPAVLQLIRRARPEPGRLRRFDPPTRLLPFGPEAGSRSPEPPGSEPRCRCADSPLPPPPGSAPEPGALSAWRPPSAVGLLFSTPVRLRNGGIVPGGALLSCFGPCRCPRAASGSEPGEWAHVAAIPCTAPRSAGMCDQHPGRCDAGGLPIDGPPAALPRRRAAGVGPPATGLWSGHPLGLPSAGLDASAPGGPGAALGEPGARRTADRRFRSGGTGSGRRHGGEDFSRCLRPEAHARFRDACPDGPTCSAARS